jgi:hypothetical protein
MRSCATWRPRLPLQARLPQRQPGAADVANPNATTGQLENAIIRVIGRVAEGRQSMLP